MTLVRARLTASFGFDFTDSHDCACLAPALALALAFVALPLCLLFPVDVDHTLPLFLLPALWLGWKLSRPAHPTQLMLVVWAFGAILLSTLFANHAARAWVTASATIWVLGGGLLARNLSPSLPAVRLVLGGIALGAVLGDLLMVAGAGPANSLCPLYTHARIMGMHQFAGAVAGFALMALHPSGKRVGLISTLLTVICLTAVATSGSRAPAVGLAVFIAAWFWCGGIRDRRFLLWAAPALTLVAILVAWRIGSIGMETGVLSAVERTTGVGSLAEASSARTYFWSVVWERIWNAPWIGHGSDAYLYIEPRLHGSQPHNMLLQWLYEHGLFGALPLALLLAWSCRGVLRRPAATSPGQDTFQAWAPSAMAGAATYGLLDGVFYHMLVFMPVAVFAGFSLGLTSGETPPRPVAGLHRFLRPALLLALVTLLLHGWLGLMLLRGRSVEPDSPPARILRLFPSTTHGLPNWLARWERTRPEVAMEWIEWAQTASFQQPEFHLAAVQIHFRNRDFISAERELRECLGKVSNLETADVQRLLDDVTVKAREQAAAQGRQ